MTAFIVPYDQAVYEAKSYNIVVRSQPSQTQTLHGVTCEPLKLTRQWLRRFYISQTICFKVCAIKLKACSCEREMNGQICFAWPIGQIATHRGTGPCKSNLPNHSIVNHRNTQHYKYSVTLIMSGELFPLVCLLSA